MPDKDRAPQEWVEMSFCGMATHRAEFSHSLSLQRTAASAADGEVASGFRLKCR